MAAADSSSSNDNDSTSDTEGEEDVDGWSQKFSAAGLPEQFDANHGPFIYLPPDAATSNFFQLLFLKYVNFVGHRKKKYAQSKNVLQGDDISVAKIKAFIGLVLATGIHKLLCMENYWNAHRVLAVT